MTEPFQPSSPTKSETLGGSLSKLREYFTLAEGKRQALTQSFSEGDLGWREYTVAQSALAEARLIDGSGEGDHAALLLYRAAVGLLLRARAARLDAGWTAESSSTALDWERYASTKGTSTALDQLTRDQRCIVDALLHENACEIGVARLSASEYPAALNGLRVVASELADALTREAAPWRRANHRQRLRIAAIGFCLATVVIVIWYRLSPPTNHALRCLVTVTNNVGEYGASSDQLVDGDRTNLGFHTDDAPNRSVTLDLGRTISIERVVVYNRADCCQERAVPLWIEVSEDGANYTRVANRQTTFVRWNARIVQTYARYVRLTHEPVGHFHLSEVEVY